MELLHIVGGLILLTIGIGVFAMGLQIFFITPKTWKKNRDAMKDPTNPENSDLIEKGLVVDIRTKELIPTYKLSKKALNKR